MSQPKDLLDIIPRILFLISKLVFPLLLLTLSIIILLNAEFPNKIHAETSQELKPTQYITADQYKKDFRNKVSKEVAAINKRLAEKNLTQTANKMEATFARYSTNMKGFAKLLITRAQECGGDPKIIFAIAGNESGFGKIPYKLYNPFGYLDGVQYTSWQDSIYTLACKISQQHLVPCNNDVNCVIIRYGGSDTNRVRWIRNVNYFMSLI